MATATAEPQGKAVDAWRSPVTFELGDDYGRNIHVLSLDLTLRGNWSQARMQSRKAVGPDGEPVHIGGRSLGDAMSRMPEIPGIRITLDPRRLTAALHDPLKDDPELFAMACKRLNEAQHVGTDLQYRPMADVTKELEPDEFKTLTEELVYKVGHGMARVVKGELPSLDQVDALEGDYLYDPGCSVKDDRPRYRKDVSDWKKRINRA